MADDILELLPQLRGEGGRGMTELLKIALHVLLFSFVAALTALTVLGVIYTAAYAMRATVEELRKVAAKEDECER